MKIGYVLDDSLDETDGVQQYVLAMGRWFSDAGNEVHYLAGKTTRKDIPKIHSLGTNLRVRFNRNYMSTPLPVSNGKIRQVLAETGFDILHIQLPFSPVFAGRVASQAADSTAVIGTFHILPYSRSVSYFSRVLGIISKRQLARFDEIVSVSEPAREFAAKGFGIYSRVVPNAVDIKLFKSGKRLAAYDDGKINIVFLGRLVERKGAMQLLRAVKLLHRSKQMRGARVIIAGKGPLRPRIEEFVRRNGLSGIVKVIGYVSEDMKLDLLQTADITVFPSLGGESFGIVLTEAMAAGSSVVIAGNNPGYKAVMGADSRQLIRPDDTGKFAERVRYYLTESDARREAIDWQNEQVKQYDISVVGKKLEAIYKNALRNKQSVR